MTFLPKIKFDYENMIVIIQLFCTVSKCIFITTYANDSILLAKYVKGM